MGKSVVQEWVSELSYRAQTVLLTGIRGCDGVEKEDLSKQFTRGLRYIILTDGCPAGAECSFMHPVDFNLYQPKFITNIDHYPIHWVLHFMHAVEIVGYCHPSINVRGDWHLFYWDIVDSCHLNIETEAQMRKRLW